MTLLKDMRVNKLLNIFNFIGDYPFKQLISAVAPSGVVKGDLQVPVAKRYTSTGFLSDYLSTAFDAAIKCTSTMLYTILIQY